MKTEAMPTTNEFKFDCPTCGQHILVATEWCGMRIECPSCKSRITIPAQSQKAEKPAPAPPLTPRAHTLPPGGTVRVESPLSARAEQATAPAPPKEGASEPARSTSDSTPVPVSTLPAQSEQSRIAVLTPAIKLDMVRAVRKRIASESSWLPGRVNGAIAYAAKISNGETVTVDVKDPEASRFSLIGAFLLEFRQGAVVQTATGRTEFLDQEIPEAIREALLDEMSDERRERTEDPLASNDLLAISHAQCLAALNVLEERYSQNMEQRRVEKDRKRLGNARLPDLVRKLETKARLAPEDVAIALYHELMDVRRRLERLESRR